MVEFRKWSTIESHTKVYQDTWHSVTWFVDLGVEGSPSNTTDAPILAQWDSAQVESSATSSVLAPLLLLQLDCLLLVGGRWWEKK